MPVDAWYSHDLWLVHAIVQEENWDAPAWQIAAPVDKPKDVKGSRGVGDASVPHAS